MSDREALQRQLSRASRLLLMLKEDEAGFGSLHVPAHMRLEIEEQEQEIAGL